MINFKIEELMKKNNLSRYRLQKLTNWNYKRVNSYYFGTAISITVAELETLCKIFNCGVSDLIEYKKD